jgi:micrococcal nuclease
MTGIPRAAAALTCLLATGCATTLPGPQTTTVTVHGRIARVVDGDTIRVGVDGDSQRVRLLGLDAPELHRPRTPVQCGARAAASALAKIAPAGTPITLTTDPGQDRYDRYGRLLAYARTPTRDLQTAQLRHGWADITAGHHRRLRRQLELEHAARDARREHRGIWRVCDGDFHRGP